MFLARPDQEDVIHRARLSMRNHQSVLLQCATGWGKTVGAGFIVKAAEEKRKRVIFGVHRKELLWQTAKTFQAMGIRFGFIAAGMSMDPGAYVQLASADTLANRRPLLATCDLLMPDEAHLWAVGAREEMVNEAKAAGARAVGLSATPERLDGKPLGDIFDDMVCGPPPAWLIEHGHLSRYRAFAPESKSDKKGVVGNIVDDYRRFAMGLRTVAFCANREHAKRVTALYNEGGIPAVYMDGNTKPAERKNAVMDFATGKALILVNVALCTEGFDLSAQVGFDVPVQAVSLQRDTDSLALAMQMMGRGLRKKPTPAVLMDHVGMFDSHGFPDDERGWSLEGKDGKAATSSAGMEAKLCAKCLGSFRPADAKDGRCPYCNEGLPLTARKAVEMLDGHISEIDLEAARRAREMDIRSARTVDELARVAVAQGKKLGWIMHLLKARGENPKYPAVAEAYNKAAMARRAGKPAA